MHQPKHIHWLDGWKHVHICTSAYQITLFDPTPNFTLLFYIVKLIMFPLWLAIVQFSSVPQSCPTFATPWSKTCQTSMSITNSWSFLKLMSIELVMPSNHLIFCRLLFLLRSVFPNIRGFSSESVLWIRWPKYWSFSFNISPSNDYSGLIFFRMDWLDLLAVQGTLKSLLQHHSSKASILWCSAFFIVQLSTSIHKYWKNNSFD